MAPNTSGMAIPHPFNTRRATPWLGPSPYHHSTGQVFNIYISRWRQHKTWNVNLKNDQQNMHRLGTVSKRNTCTAKLQQVSLVILIWWLGVKKMKKIVGSNNFSAQLIKIISHYKKIGYNINVLQQTACLVVNPITVGNFAFLFNCTPVGRNSDLKDLSIDEMVEAWCSAVGRAHRGLTVGFILLRYSVLFTVESLSLLYLFFISWFICSRRWCINKLRGLSWKPNIYVS